MRRTILLALWFSFESSAAAECKGRLADKVLAPIVCARYNASVALPHLGGPTLRAGALFVIPSRTTHPPHWLEELAQFTNALVSDVRPERHGSKVAFILQDMPSLLPFLVNFTEVQAKARAAMTSDWHEFTSSVLTASLMRASVDVVLFPDGTAVNVLLGTTYKVSSVDAHRWYERDFTPLIPSVTVGLQWFASRTACSHFRSALEPVSSDYLSATLTPTGATIELLRIAVVNRAILNDGRSISEDSAKVLMKHLRAEFPGAFVEYYSQDAGLSLVTQIHIYSQSDVVITPQGANMVFLPLMKLGSLIIDVYGPTHSGTALSYFLGLGEACGLIHRVYHEGRNHQIALTRQGKPGNMYARAHPVELKAETIAAWIADWLAAAPFSYLSILDDSDLYAKFRSERTPECKSSSMSTHPKCDDSNAP